MTLVLVAGPGLANSNSYATVAEADAYHESRLHVDTWTGATTPTKDAALVWATRLLDSTIVWNGWPKDPDFQRLQWPRTGLLKRGGFEELADDVIPEDLVFATSELARLLIEEDRTEDNQVEAQGITSLTVPGPVSLAFKDGVRLKILPDSVTNLLPPEWIQSRTDRPQPWRNVVRV